MYLALHGQKVWAYFSNFYPHYPIMTRFLVKKMVTATFLLCVLAFSWVSCTNDQPNTSNKSPENSNDAFTIYQKYCAVCHGNDGALGFSGAANLRTSQLDLDATRHAIAKGKGAMKAYEGTLLPEQIAALADYVATFRK